MTKHTPGPWLMDEEGQIFSAGAHVATVHVRQYPKQDVWDWDTAGADGALICAAPELLDAAKKFVSALDAFLAASPGLKSGPEVAALRAAIAKANAA